MSRASASLTSFRSSRARISDAPIAVARTRCVCGSTSIVTSTFSGAAPSLTTASNASRLMRLRSSGCGLGMTRSTISRTSASATPIEEITSASCEICVKAGAAGDEGNQRRRAAALADQQRLIAIEPVFGDQVLDHRNDLVGGDLEDGARGILDRFADEAGERRHGAPRRLRDCRWHAIRAWRSQARWRRRYW